MQYKKKTNWAGRLCQSFTQDKKTSEVVVNEIIIPAVMLLQNCHEKTEDKWQENKNARGEARGMAEAKQRQVTTWFKWFIKVLKKCHVRETKRNGNGRSWISNIRLWNYYILNKYQKKHFWTLFSLTYLFICVIINFYNSLNRLRNTILLWKSSFWLIFLINLSIYWLFTATQI